MQNPSTTTASSQSNLSESTVPTTTTIGSSSSSTMEPTSMKKEEASKSVSKMTVHVATSKEEIVPKDSTPSQTISSTAVKT